MWRWLRNWLARKRAGPGGEPPAPPRLEPRAGDAMFEFQFEHGRWLERLLRDRYPLLRALPESLAETAVRELRREAKIAARRTAGESRGEKRLPSAGNG